MVLKPGETRMSSMVQCPDLAKAVPIIASMLEDESGWLSPFPPRVNVKGSDGLPEVSSKTIPSGGIRTGYGNIKNFHATKDITVKVNVAVKALEAGSHTCQVKFGGTNPVDLSFEAIESPATPPSNVSASIYSYGPDLSSGFDIDTQGPGGIEIRGLELGETEIYSGESLALELDVTVPPWDGGQGIDFTFELETQVVTIPLNLKMFFSRVNIITTGAYVEWRSLRLQTTWSALPEGCLSSETTFPPPRQSLTTTSGDGKGKGKNLVVSYFGWQVCRQG